MDVASRGSSHRKDLDLGDSEAQLGRARTALDDPRALHAVLREVSADAEYFAVYVLRRDTQGFC